jgi:alkylation response protein AidB-like acyl-CoA dehydrogenase
MDLELSDEQRWLSESIETLLTREWVSPEAAATAGDVERRRLWAGLVEFGALSVDPEDGLGAVELCLIARGLGAHLASVPYLGSAALRYAAAGFVPGEEPVALALLEPGVGWALERSATELAGGRLTGEKVAVEHFASALAVLASADGAPALVLVPAGATGVELAPQPAFDATVPTSAVTFAGVAPAAVLEDAAGAVERLTAIGGLLAAAEAAGAADRLLEAARAYAGERRQFGRTIGSRQALRHLLADMYVRSASSWSTVLYAAAALDEDLEDAMRTASIAKAYVARAAREVAHGALQVFGGIAFTQEHVAHRYLRRIVVRERQFGDAAFHERRLGRALAAAAAEPVS